MSKLATLRQRQIDLKAEATKLLDTADNETEGVLSEEDENRFNAIEVELKEVASDISDEEKNLERRRKLDAIQTAAPQVPARHITSDEPDPQLTYGFNSLGEFAQAVAKASHPAVPDVDSRLLAAPTNYHEGGGAAGEGYMLPVEYRNEIWEAISEVDDVIGTVDLEETSARQVDMVADETTPWGSSGVQAYWRAEAAQMTASKLDTDGRSVPLHELYAFVLATEELLEDAPRLNARVQRKAPLAMAWKASDAIVNGTGSGQPLGWFNSDALVTVAKEGSQAADTIDDQNILKMYSRLMVVPGDTPYWMANRDVIPQLAAITIGDQPIWLPNQNVIGDLAGTLLGYPLRLSEHAKTLGDKGDIQLISPKGYYAARRTAGIQFAESIHLFFDYNIKAFRFIFRFGGQPHLSAPVSPANGSNTKSHFVTLAERA